jgi:hypothetical protein
MPTIFNERVRWQPEPELAVTAVTPAALVVAVDFELELHAAATIIGITPEQTTFKQGRTPFPPSVLH